MEQPIDSVMSQPPQVTGSNRAAWLKFLITIGVVVVLAGGAYAGIWYWGNQNSQVAIPSFTPRPTPVIEGQFCGGIAAGQFQCPSGYTCKLDGDYPDAGGKCVIDPGTTSSSSTLSGHVTIGPNCPVEQVGHPCTPAPAAYTSRSVSVYQANGATLVGTHNFDTNGNYNFSLSPGTYVVKSKTSIGSIEAAVGTITIKSGQTATLNFSIDTGIR